MLTSKNITLVMGASENPERYSNKAIKLLLKKGKKVTALGNKKGSVDQVEIRTGFPDFEDIHTISLYINPTIQEQYYDYMISLNPERIIFNPGTENDYFKQLAESKGIATEYACTLVLLNLGQY